MTRSLGALVVALAVCASSPVLAQDMNTVGGADGSGAAGSPRSSGGSGGLATLVEGAVGGLAGGVASVVHGGSFSDGALAGAQAAMANTGSGSSLSQGAQAGAATAQASGAVDNTLPGTANYAPPAQTTPPAETGPTPGAGDAAAPGAVDHAPPAPPLPADLPRTDTPPPAGQQTDPQTPFNPADIQRAQDAQASWGQDKAAPPATMAGADGPKRYQVLIPDLPAGREYKGGNLSPEQLAEMRRLGLGGAEVEGDAVNPNALSAPEGEHKGDAASQAEERETQHAVQAKVSSAQNRLAMKDYGGALADAKSAIAMAPGSSDAYLLAAQALNRLGRYAEAQAMAAKALRLRGNMVNRARAGAETVEAMLFQGRSDEALAEAKAVAAMALQAGDAGLAAKAYFMQAAACQLRGDRQCMRDALQRAALLDARYYAALAAARAGKDIFDPKDGSCLRLMDAPRRELPVAAALRLLYTLLMGLVASFAGAVYWLWWRSRRKPTVAQAMAADGRLLGGRYELGRAVPSGGRGEMWEARDHSLGRSAMALLLPSPEAAAEARRLAAAHHPNIIDVFEVVEGPKGAYLVTECLKGRTLRQLLAARGPLDLDEARRLLKPVCEALQYARGQGVVAGSLDLSSVMLTDEGYIKVLDVAARPEAAGRSDVQALAACLEEMLTGEPPRPGALPSGLPFEAAGLLLDAASGSVREPAAFAARLDRVVEGAPAGRR